MIHPNAKKYETLTLAEVVEKKLGVIDLTASITCLENKIPLAIFSLKEENGIANAMLGRINGTTVTV